jgi:hypothetical protein
MDFVTGWKLSFLQQGQVPLPSLQASLDALSSVRGLVPRGMGMPILSYPWVIQELVFFSCAPIPEMGTMGTQFCPPRRLESS